MKRAMEKQARRLKRAKKTRLEIIRNNTRPRLVVSRSNQHIRAQLIDLSTDTVLAYASTLDKDVRDTLKNANNKAAAETVGQVIGAKIVAAGVKEVAFDRNGRRYHGCIKALADKVREQGVEF